MSEYDTYNFLAEGSVIRHTKGLPWVTLGRQSYRAKSPKYHHTEWPGPTPSAWYGTVFNPPSNPTSAVSLSETCANDLIRSNVCKANASCQLGIISGMQPELVQLSSDPSLNTRDFQHGRTMHKQCIDHQVQSFFGTQGAVGTA
jgi:hypothetical protein